MGLDPLTGWILWIRSDIPLRSRIFGDDARVYLVELDGNNAATDTRAFRAQEGATERVPDFATLSQKCLRVMGRTLLLSEKKADGLTLRLYDFQTGKDVWSKSFPPESVAFQSEHRMHPRAVSDSLEVLRISR
jgi:hypothetical protein